MSDTTTTTEGTTAPAAPAATSQDSPAAPAAPQVPPASPPATDAETVRMTPAQLKARLEEQANAATRKLLKDLGFDKPEDIKSAAARLKALEDEKLSEAERTAKQIKELQAAAEAAKPAALLASEAVGELFAALPEDQQKAIDEEANGDPAARLRLIKFARKLAPAPSAPAVTSQQPSAAPPAALPSSPASPATTAPPVAAPRQSAVKTKYETWQEMVARNDRAADIFYSLNERAIRASAPPAQ